MRSSSIVPRTSAALQKVAAHKLRTATAAAIAVPSLRAGSAPRRLFSHRHCLVLGQQIIGSIIYRHDDFADAITTLAAAGVEIPRHVTGTIPLDDIVSRGFVPLIEQRADHVKILVRPR